MNYTDNNSKHELINPEDYNELVDDDLAEKIRSNKFHREKKSIASKIVVKILSVLFILISVLTLYYLLKPYVVGVMVKLDEVKNSVDLFSLIRNVVSSNDNGNLIVNVFYAILLVINIVAGVIMFKLNNLGRLMHVFVLLALITIRVFYILYKELKGYDLNVSLISIAVMVALIILLLNKQISKAF